MIQKLIIGLILSSATGVLVFGAVTRTNAAEVSTAVETYEPIPAISETLTVDPAQEITVSLTETPLATSGAMGETIAETNGYGNGDESGTGAAEVEEWVVLDATITEVGSDQFLARTGTGDVIEIYGRSFSFALEQGFWAQAGDALRLTGFYEDGDFETGRIENLTNGLAIDLRDANGRPLWGGRGRGGNGGGEGRGNGEAGG